MQHMGILEHLVGRIQEVLYLIAVKHQPRLELLININVHKFM